MKVITKSKDQCEMYEEPEMINRKPIMILSLILFFHFSFFLLPKVNASDTDGDKTKQEKKVFTNKNDNAKCFKCHGNRKYGITSTEDPTKIIFRRMPLDYIIDTTEFYISNHWNLKCTDCHSDKYVNTPHNQELRFIDMPICIDCHGGDKAYKKYNFEIIESEFKKSVHYKNERKDFSCWSCHNPHSYKINARNKHLAITKTVEYDNSICLGCHDNNENLSYFNKKISNLVSTHSWLPNQEDHFRQVRCIECHAVINDSILAPHNIQPKAKAIRECSRCHSTNSLLTRSLYKNRSNKDSLGFFNSKIMSDSYVAGTNRNYFLNIASLIIYALSLIAISVHIYFRIKRRKNMIKH